MHHGIHHFFGRHHGHGRFGRFGGGFWDEGGRGGRGFGMGRKLGGADLQLLVLALLKEQPRHGYEIIKALEERSQGFYVPSPGMVYPALTYLEEIGYATVEADGARKRYHITATGEAHLAERREAADAMFAQFERIGQKMERVRRAFSGDDVSADTDSKELNAAYRELREALHSIMHARRGAVDAEEARRIAEILKRAAADINSKDSKC